MVFFIGVVADSDEADSEFKIAKLEVLERPIDFFTGDDGSGKGLLLGLVVRFVEIGCDCDVPVGVGKGRPRFGEGGSGGRATVAGIASLGKGLLDPGDGLSAD